MLPGFKHGDLVIAKKNRKVASGDVVVFQDTVGRIIIHRIIGPSNEGYRTKGDNSKHQDPGLVQTQKILGLVCCRIPLLGYPRIWLENLMNKHLGE